jgi:DNA-binding IclR family transcriptional regulator
LAENTIVSPEKLRTHLAQIRTQGYATSFSEQSHGSAGVSAPVRDHSGQVVAGMTISGPQQRFTAERVECFIDMVQKGAQLLSLNLGWKAPPPKTRNADQPPG